MTFRTEEHACQRELHLSHQEKIPGQNKGIFCPIHQSVKNCDQHSFYLTNQNTSTCIVKEKLKFRPQTRKTTRTLWTSSLLHFWIEKKISSQSYKRKWFLFFCLFLLFRVRDLNPVVVDRLKPTVLTNWTNAEIWNEWHIFKRDTESTRYNDFWVSNFNPAAFPYLVCGKALLMRFWIEFIRSRS